MMNQVRGLAAMSKGAPFVALGSHDVLIDIAYAGICHSDIHQVREEWGPAIFPMVPGHEIAGVVREVGAAVSKFSVGDHIGVGVFIDSCRQCKPCKDGLEQYCDQGMTGTYNTLERDGVTVAMGGYSNKFVVDEKYAVKIAPSLPLDGVAPLLCAGITLYSPLKHWNVAKGSRVAIMGLGGLGHMGVKFAHALGAHVTVLSHSANKEADARAMGADDFVVVKSPDDLKPLSRSFDLILNTVSAQIDINIYIATLKIDGTLVVIGLPGAPYPVHVGSLLNGRKSLAGSMIGGIAEMQEMIDFCATHSIVSDIEVINADYVDTAYERTVASDVKYRFVIDATTI
jgi:uncharacterized zinc-type alcohol dehydrogenase-like protein